MEFLSREVIVDGPVRNMSFSFVWSTKLVILKDRFL